MKKFFELALQDASGGVSSIRFLMLVWGLIVLIGWIVVCIKTGGLVEIPSSIITILLGLTGIKVAQRFGEKESVAEPVFPPSPNIVVNPSQPIPTQPIINNNIPTTDAPITSSPLEDLLKRLKG
jgi:hypothetical protein